MDRRAALLALTVVGLAVSLFPTARSGGPTPVEGPVVGVWTLDGSPYVLVANATVPEGGKLEIQAGVEVRAHRGVGLDVLGTLLVLGSPGARVRFTSDEPGDAGYWKGIGVQTGVASLSHAAIDGAETALSVSGGTAGVVGSQFSGNLHGLRVEDGAADLMETSISHNAFAGVIARNAALTIGGGSLLAGNPIGMRLESADALVENTTFLGPVTNDLVLDVSSKVRLRACEHEEPPRIEFLDGLSRVDVEGILAVSVLDVHGSPRADARIEVNDNANGTGGVVTTTGGDGGVPGVVLRERTETAAGAVDFNPFTVAAEANGWRDSADVTVHGATEVALRLSVDLAPPEPARLGILFVDEDQEFVLDASGSRDNDPGLASTGSFLWSFPELALTLVGIQVTHTFPDPGLVEGVLTVTDAAGNSGDEPFSVRVRDRTPPVILEPRVSGGGLVGETITLEAFASDNDPAFDAGAEYSWRFSLGSAIAERRGRTVTFVPDRAGTWAISLTVTDPEGNPASRELTVRVVAPTPQPDFLPAIVGGSILLASAAALATERGKVGLLTLLIPLYTRLKDGEVLDQFTRGQIYGYVRVHPGDTYTDIKRNLDLNNGTLTYHLDVLEKQGLLRAVARGPRKMFYPIDVRPPEDGGGLHEVQRRLVKGLDEAPGIAVADLAASLGISRQLALYHLRILVGRGIVRLERRGFRLCGSLRGRETLA